VMGQDVERLRADRSGRSEDDNAARHAREVRVPGALGGSGSGCGRDFAQANFSATAR
jgi:hypothetical protein